MSFPTSWVSCDRTVFVELRCGQWHVRICGQKLDDPLLELESCATSDNPNAAFIKAEMEFISRLGWFESIRWGGIHFHHAFGYRLVPITEGPSLARKAGGHAATTPQARWSHGAWEYVLKDDPRYANGRAWKDSDFK